MCRGCHPAETEGWGDGISYLREIRGMSFQEAKQFLGIDSLVTLPSKPLHNVKDFESQSWQKRADGYSEEAIDRLWSSAGTIGLDYLHGRGLIDETIANARLGYAVISNADWNKAPCIVFPWFSDGQYWRIQYRTVDLGSPKEKRYRMVKGSSNSGLYLADALRLKRPVFLVEGELDALSIAQEAGDCVIAVATGTTTGSRAPKWEALLSCAKHVFIAFDRDEKGNAAAEYWLGILPNAIRWQPIVHDINDMLRYGLDIISWVQAALGEYDDRLKCHTCQQPFPSFEGWDPDKIPADEIMSFDPGDGNPYCEKCRPDLFEQVQELATA